MTHRFHNCEHFQVRDPIVALCRYALAGEEGDWMPGGTMELANDAGNSETRSISVETNWERRVEMLEDGGSCKTTFELVEGSLAGRGPVETLALIEQ